MEVQYLQLVSKPCQEVTCLFPQRCHGPSLAGKALHVKAHSLQFLLFGPKHSPWLRAGLWPVLDLATITLLAFGCSTSLLS